MPFTVTHIAAIVPMWAARPTWLPFTALAIGTMTPDLPLYLPFPIIHYYSTHSVPGVVTVCLPVGMGLFLLFELYERLPLFALFPSWVQARALDLRQPRVQLSLSFFVRSSLAIVLGAASHVLWDSFTHIGWWGTRQIPVLNATWIYLPNGVEVSGARVFQHGSTIVFLPAMTLAAVGWLWRRTPGNVPESTTCSTTAKGIALAFLVMFAFAVLLGTWDSETGLGSNITLSVTRFGLGLMVVAALYATGFHLLSPGDSFAERPRGF